MKNLTLKTIFWFFIFLAFQNQGFGQETKCSECDINTALTLISEMNEKNIACFFHSINKKCLGVNIEFSELANELVFATLDKNTKDFISEFSKQKKGKQRIILSMLESPVSDTIEIKSIIGKVLKDSTQKKCSKKILISLDIAQSKM